MKYLPLLCLPALLVTACYEDQIACLDPDANNFDVNSDEACPDCCTYPDFTVSFTRTWGGEPFAVDSVYTDGAGNPFRIVRLRFYLGDVQLLAGETSLPIPENSLEVDQAIVGDTTTVQVNDNNLLVTTSGGNRDVGTYRGGASPITGLSATLGLSPLLGAVIPSTAPAASPLSTQAGLLYDRQAGRGYVQASLEYQFVGDTAVNRQDVYGVEPFTLPFPEPIPPLRGSSLTVSVEVDYRAAFVEGNLRTRPAEFADGLIATLRVIQVE